MLEAVRLENDPAGFARELAKVGEHPEVVSETCYGKTEVRGKRSGASRCSGYHAALNEGRDRGPGERPLTTQRSQIAPTVATYPHPHHAE